MSVAQMLMKAPIQGENLTRNTKQYAWHRPPQYSNFDEAFRYFVDTYIANKDSLGSEITFVMGGMPASTLVSSILVNMVGQGKISPDMSLLLAGPTYKVLTRVLDYASVKYLSGFESTKDTAMFFKSLTESVSLNSEVQEPLPKDVIQDAQEIAETIEMPTGGLMGARSGEAEDNAPIDLGASEPTNLMGDASTTEEDLTNGPS